MTEAIALAAAVVGAFFMLRRKSLAMGALKSSPMSSRASSTGASYKFVEAMFVVVGAVMSVAGLAIAIGGWL
jgi:hypothetical protein